MTSSNPATNGGGGMGVMENLMAMQSVQAIQSILSSKEGWTKQNLISFAVVSFSDTIKRLLNSSVDSLISHRVDICMYVAKIVKNGWSAIWKAIVYAVKLRFFRDIFFSLRRSAPETCPKQPSNEDDASAIRPIEIDIAFRSTLHEWRSILSSPDISFRKHSRFSTERINVSTTFVSELLLDVSLRTPLFTMQPNTSLEVKWSITRHSTSDPSSSIIYDTVCPFKTSSTTRTRWPTWASPTSSASC